MRPKEGHGHSEVPPPPQRLKLLKPEMLPLETLQEFPTPRGCLPFLWPGQQARNSITFALVGKWKLPAVAIVAVSDKPARDGAAVGQRVGTNKVGRILLNARGVLLK